MSEYHFKVGDRVWRASYERSEKMITCPVCFGKKKITVILGDDSRYGADCEYCSQGYMPPTGTIKDIRLGPEVELLIIDAVERRETSAGEKVEYRSGHWVLYPDKIFPDKEAALARAQELVDEAQVEETKRVNYLKENAKKSYSWHVGYYLRLAKDHEQKALRYREKVVLCKAKEKQ